ncbi:hypothetical protein TNCV_3006571 [Trichonephila clavipes]|nr:hypothetical protein TNCV_3006571 [Trichonephila clavipes]
MSAADIHRQITEVYGTEAMSDSKVREGVKKFKDGWTNVHDEERSGRPSVINDDLIQEVVTKFLKVVTAKCLGGPLVDRDLLNAHSGSMEWRTHPFPSRSKLNKRCQTARLWQQCSGTDVVCSGGLCSTKNNDKLRCRLCNSTENLESIAKQTARHAIKRCFAPQR